MDRKRNIRRIGEGYLQTQPAFQRPILWNLSRCIKANVNDAAVIIEYE